jgi:hypothetical protein
MLVAPIQASPWGSAVSRLANCRYSFGIVVGFRFAGLRITAISLSPPFFAAGSLNFQSLHFLVSFSNTMSLSLITVTFHRISNIIFIIS